MKHTIDSSRLHSLDAIRGFDMFWIIGAERFFHSLAQITDSPFWDAVAVQMNHPDWHGFTFFDLIFPLFLFLAGVAIPYSLGRQLEKGAEKKALLAKIVKRAFILVLLGIVYNNGLSLLALSEIRFGSVLGRIGLAYMFASILYLYFNQRTQAIWFMAILLGYWALLGFNAAPSYPIGDMSMEGNFVSYIDTLVMPGKLYLGIHDPEGLLATIPAIATALLGIYTGNLLKNSPAEKHTATVIRLALIGALLIVIAQLWNLAFPINKNLWTSSFVLQCGGISMLLMAFFYYVIDVLGYQKWAFFFKIIGMNSILIYMSELFIDWSYTTNSLFNWLGQLVGEPYHVLVMAFCYVLVQWFFLRLLYQQKLFLRV